VTESSLRDSPVGSRIVHIALTYVQVLAHVRYSAVGINFRSLTESEAPEAFLRYRFLRSGPWAGNILPLQGVGLRLVNPLEEGKLILSLDSGSITEKNNDRTVSGILIHSNFHRDCQGYPAVDQLLSHLGRLKHDWERYQQFISDLLGS
jgi:hypothetical protein